MSEFDGSSSADALIEKLQEGLPGPANGRPVILAVDDVRANIFLIESILLDEFNVVSASKTSDMWQYLKRRKPDLILLDLMMPEEDGFAVLEKLKADPDMMKIPVIVVTAKDTREDVIKATRLGALDFITKPVKDDILLSKVHKILQK